MNNIILPKAEEISTENLFTALIDLLGVMHQNGLDEEAKRVCAENGITLEITQE